MVLPRFHPRAPRLVWRCLGALVLLSAAACDKQELESAANDASAPTDENQEAKTPQPEPAPPPPAVEGAVYDAFREGVYVQRCSEPCPDMLQDAGAEHCSGLQLAGRSWRLPSKDEAARFGSLGLEQTSGYHWTSTAYDQDDAQTWIVDPESDQPTTIPRDRKPFRVRCVSDREPTAGPNTAE